LQELGFKYLIQALGEEHRSDRTVEQMDTLRSNIDVITRKLSANAVESVKPAVRFWQHLSDYKNLARPRLTEVMDYFSSSLEVPRCIKFCGSTKMLIDAAKAKKKEMEAQESRNSTVGNLSQELDGYIDRPDELNVHAVRGQIARTTAVLVQEQMESSSDPQMQPLAQKCIKVAVLTFDSMERPWSTIADTVVTAIVAKDPLPEDSISSYC